ncbi:TPA: hypothetical protein MED91_005292 [Klebsiella pneumoniae]|uniref:hypothetical protein n=1 Tax=Klebsiella quasipneumoniae TaxID=1463165 RepID=UPI0011586841|nr:hypothetical protein [Klebsiella quasipneumoniae]HBW0909846.1 hypothetical protein [Klebsiella pneumoniae]HBW0915334.1 hypothetical protein [Klebsiella pneumoniae]
MMLKKIIIALPIIFISGCGLAQHAQLSEQRSAQEAQRILSQPGMQALNYVVEDDAATARDGGKSLCSNGCTMQDAISLANKNPVSITGLYLAIHEYRTPPSTYKSDDYVVRNRTLADIFNNVSSTLGSSSLNDVNYISNAYASFLNEYSVLGLRYLTKDEFYNASRELYKKRADLVTDIASIRNEALQRAAYKEQQNKIEFDKENPSVRVNTDNAIIRISNNRTVKKAFSKLVFTTKEKSTPSESKVFLEGMSYKPSLDLILKYVEKELYQCKRVSAFADEDINKQCENLIGSGISAFADMVNNKGTPDKTKIAAVSEATIGGYLDFGYAARLAKMHDSLCKQQGDNGYVTMVTIAAPCKKYKGAGIE